MVDAEGLDTGLEIVAEDFEGFAHRFAVEREASEVFEHADPLAGAVGVGVDDPVQVVQSGSNFEGLGENSRQ